MTELNDDTVIARGVACCNVNNIDIRLSDLDEPYRRIITDDAVDVIIELGEKDERIADLEAENERLVKRLTAAEAMALRLGECMKALDALDFDALGTYPHPATGEPVSIADELHHHSGNALAAFRASGGDAE